MKDIEAIRNELVRQLDWKGPGGRGQGHIVLGRLQAEILVQWIELHMQMETLDDELKGFIENDAAKDTNAADQAR